MAGTPWWHNATFYQLYLRSFADGDGDGVGDLLGATDKLGYLSSLGVDAVWLSPVFPSPNADFGYDVADYLDVEPSLGGMPALTTFLTEARRQGLRVLLDIVPGHTSVAHEWFRLSRSPESPYRDYYVWVDGPDLPNNWLSTLGVPAWTWDPSGNAWYLHNYFAGQADLNWHNPSVQLEFARILEYWFGAGVDGFRIDVAHGVYKDRHLRDNPPATIFDVPRDQSFGQRQLYNTEQPEVHELYRQWRKLADSFGDRVLMGETYVLDTPRLASFAGSNCDELHLPQNIMLPTAPFRAQPLRDIVEAMLLALPAGAGWSTFLSNHDMSRCATRWAGGDARKVRLALLMLLTLPCSPILYYGDEIGLPDCTVRAPLDEVAVVAPPGRDIARGPMPWTPTEWRDSGFWLDVSDPVCASVAEQETDPDSTLNLCRGLLSLRRREPSLRDGRYVAHPTMPADCWAYYRGDVLVVLNMSDRSLVLSGVREVLAASGHAGTVDAGVSTVSVLPWSGVVVRPDPVEHSHIRRI